MAAAAPGTARRGRYGGRVSDGMSDGVSSAARELYAGDRAAAAFGIELVESSPERAVVRMAVLAEYCNGFLMLHGGMTFLLADTAMAFASNAATDAAIDADGHGTLASSAEIDWLAPVRAGQQLTATAIRRWSSGRSALWDVTVADADGAVVALMRGRTRATRLPPVA